ncbi:MAG: MFS transporter [Comamonas sp.]
MSPPARKPAATWRYRVLRHALDLAPLRNTSFSWLYTVRLIAVVVYGVLGITVAWQVWGLTQSSLKVAGVGVGLALGTMLGLMVGGFLADRVNRRTIMVAGRAAYIPAVVLLLINSLQTSPQVEWIYLATVLSGLTGGISAPALMASVPALLPPQQLAAAGALGALAEQLGRLIGPLLAAALISFAGSSACYTLALAGALATPLLLLRLPSMPPPTHTAVARPPPAWRAWREGLLFAWRNPVVGGLLLLDVLMAVAATPWVLLPQLGVESLGGDAQLVGWLHAAPAAGALVAAASSGWTRRLQRPGALLIVAAMVWGLALASAGASTQAIWVLALLVLAGAADTVADIVRGALLQLHTPDALRGRVSALWLMEMHLAPAAGGVFLGGAAQRWSASAALLAGGLVCACTSLLAGGFNRSLRHSPWRCEQTLPSTAPSN